jgi:hypothetical protein
VAAKIDELSGDHVVALHDRRATRPDGRASRANLDHLVVAAAGVWVVDAKAYSGTLNVRREGGVFTPRVEKLFIAGRDRSSLVDGIEAQVDLVRVAVASVGADIPVRGMLCFIGTELPLLCRSVREIALVGRRGLSRMLKEPGAFSARDRADIGQFLAQRFPPA